jgi:hypothetical protein
LRTTPEGQGILEPRLPLAAESATPDRNNETTSEDSSTWRQEVAARLNRFQSRRKPRPPRYPSLRLRFEDSEPGYRQVPVSNQALALDAFAAADPVDELTDSHHRGGAHEAATNSFTEERQNAEPPSFVGPTVTAKIIEFPRSWTPPLPALDELAEPAVNLPRILDVPEFVPAPPALGGITIEPMQQIEPEKRPGIDIPLQSAPLERRILAATVDGVIIAGFCGVFALIFWKLTAIRPPRMQILGVIGGLASVLWSAYQYLLLVYAGTTPGLRLARLELLRFDERRPTRRLRRWRVLASYLSAVSLGMGYVWVFLDEDSLCWHDRITHTYLAPKTREPDRPNSDSLSL